MGCVVLAMYPTLMALNNKIHHLNKCCSISDPLLGQGSAVEQDRNWTVVAPGDTVPLAFKGLDSFNVCSLQ
jgi:hypothetical protein